MNKRPSRSAGLLGELEGSVWNRRVLPLKSVGPETAQGFVIQELAHRLPDESTLFVVAKDPKDAATWNEILSLFNVPTTLYLTAEELFAALANNVKRRVIILPAETLLQPLPRDKRKVTIELTKNTPIKPGDLCAWLVEHGYRFEKAADLPKSFARRGGIVDCYIPGRHDTIRIEFSGNTIEDITTFVPHNKTKPIKLERIMITAADLPPDGADTLLSYISKDERKSLLIFRDSDEFAHTLPGWNKLESKLEEYTQMHFETISTMENADALNAKALPILPKHWDQIAEFLKEQKNSTTIILTKNQKRLKGFLKEYGLAGAVKEIHTRTHSTSYQGFISETLGVLIVTDRDLFGIEQTTEEGLPRSGALDKLWVATLNEGSFVVHLDHGIGRFTGTTVQKVGDVEREYFVLEYAEGDKLFVPVELADKLSKYIGVPNPSMTRLSGGNWKEVTEKVKQDTLAIAKELLSVAAERERAKAPILKGEGAEDEAKLEDSFPYEETPDQGQAIHEVAYDLEQTTPMDRLICGDVGFGKTEVAIRAAFKAAANGYQVAVLSPTTILAQQHFDTFVERLEAFDVKVDLLSRFRSAKSQQRVLASVRSGDVDIVIGTHRLLSDDVHFKKIGLLIIDEEQRFGVQAKEYLKRLRKEVHVLSLSATPIPRTLHLSLSGLRDLSIIKTPPAGRKPITTHIAPYSTGQIKRIIEKEIERGGQAYYVYNKVETIIPKMKELKKLVPQARFGIAHGQLAEIDLAKAMSSFDHGDIDVLIASTIIENGLDLPNVNTMIVEDAPNFGLAQLYQLRGRIGRGDRDAFAYFFYHEQKLAPDARKRLSALMEAERLGSGIDLAMRDMEIRGIGNILGKAQHGRAQAIGLALYSRLLKQAIQEMRGQDVTPLSEVDIDLPISIGIPKNIVYEETDRLRLYQELANEEEVDSLHKKAQREFREPFAEPITNLIYALECKIVSRTAQIKSITTESPVSGKRFVVVARDQFGPEAMGIFIKQPELWDITNERAKISMEALGDNWKKKLLKILRQLTNLYAMQANAKSASAKASADKKD
ncbi:MAG: transcription-repair coupling factor [Patescibacteria group bacterium]